MKNKYFRFVVILSILVVILALALEKIEDYKNSQKESAKICINNMKG